MLSPRLCLGLLAGGCASAHSEVLEPPSDRPALWDGATLAEAPPEDVATCPIEIPPAPEAMPAPSDPPGGRCGKPSRAVARKLRQQAHDRWYLSEEDAKLEVDFACDPFAPKLGELVVETSDGHGFTLHLDRIRPRTDGDYDLLRLAYASTGNYVPAPTNGRTSTAKAASHRRACCRVRHSRPRCEACVRRCTSDSTSASPCARGWD